MCLVGMCDLCGRWGDLVGWRGLDPVTFRPVGERLNLCPLHWHLALDHPAAFARLVAARTVEQARLRADLALVFGPPDGEEA